MKISTKGRYGLRAMLYLAINSDTGYITLETISKREEISKEYLEHIFSILKKVNLVKSTKGSKGGYILSDKPSKITIASILYALEGDLSVADYIIEGKEQDNSIDYCLKINIWDKINKEVTKFIESITLEDLINKYMLANNDSAPTFCI